MSKFSKHNGINIIYVNKIFKIYVSAYSLWVLRFNVFSVKMN